MIADRFAPAAALTAALALSGLDGAVPQARGAQPGDGAATGRAAGDPAPAATAAAEDAPEPAPPTDPAAAPPAPPLLGDPAAQAAPPPAAPAQAQTPRGAAPPPLPPGLDSLPDGSWRLRFPAGAAALPPQAGPALAELGRRLAAGAPPPGNGRYTLLAQASGPEADHSAARRLSLARGIAVKEALAAGGLADTRIDIRPLGRTGEALDAVDVLPPGVQRPPPAPSAP